MTTNFAIQNISASTLALFFAFTFSLFSKVPLHGQDKDEPFRVLVVPNDQVEKLLNKKLQSPHRLLSISEFNDLKKRLPPTSKQTASANLVTSVYLANWNGNQLSGKAKWDLDCGTSGSFFIPLDNLNLAIKNFDTKGNQGWLGEWEPGKYSLFAPNGNLKTVEFDWTLQARWSLNGYHVQVKIPPTPSGSFEIIHTPDWNCVLLSKGIQQTSNLNSQPEKKVTLLTCSGESSIDLLFSPTNNTGTNNTLLSSMVSKHQIKESHCVSEFELFTSPDSVFRGDLNLDTSPGLEITEVNSQAIHQWTFVPGEQKKKGALKISISNSFPPIKPISIKGFHHPVDQKNPWWNCPSLTNSNKRPIPEQISVILDHGMLVEEINPGDFTPNPALKSDRQILMNFQGGAFSAKKKDLSHPSIRFLVQPSKFQSVVYSNFSPEIGQGIFSNAAYLKVLHGAIQFFSFEIPRDYKVESLGINRQDNKIRDWSTINTANKQILRIELDKPLISLDSPEMASTMDLPCITVNLSTSTPTSKLRDWVFPFFIPLYASSIDGYFGISARSNQQKITIRTDFQPTTLDDQKLPLLKDALAVFKYSGNSPTGFADLNQIKGLVKSQLAAKYHLSEKELFGELTFAITPETGSVNFIDIITPKNLKPDQWDWHSPGLTTAIAKIEKIPTFDPVAIALLIGNTSAAGKIGSLPLLEKNLVWRIHFATPISGNQAMTLNASWKTQDWNWPVDIPLVFLRDENFEKMQISISTAKSITPSFQVKDAILLPGDRIRSADFLVQSPSSVITISEKKNPSLTDGVISHCEILKSFNISGEETHSIQADISFWNSDFIQIQLPDGSNLTEVWMDGKQLQGIKKTGIILSIPIPEESKHPRIFFKYSIPFGNRWLWEMVQEKEPAFPVKPLQKKIWWVLPDGWTALTNGNFFSGLTSGSKSSVYKTMRNSGTPNLNMTILKETIAKSRITVATDTISETLSRTLGELNNLVPDLVVDSFAIRNTSQDISPGVYPLSDLLQSFGLNLVIFGKTVLLTSSKYLDTSFSNSQDFLELSLMEYLINNGSDRSGRFLAIWNLAGLLANKASNSTDLLGRELSAIPMKVTGVSGGFPKFFLFIFHTNRLFALGSLLGLFLYFQAKKHLDLKTNVSWIAIPVLFAICMILAPAAITPFLLVPFGVLTILELSWFWRMVQKSHREENKSIPLKSSATVATTALTWISLNIGFVHSQTPLPEVFFLPANPEKSRQAAYMVPEAMLQIKKSSSGKAIIEKSIYKGNLAENGLDFSFTIAIQSTGPCQLSLPFKGIWFKDNLVLNEKIALNTYSNSEQFAIQIPSAGSHKLSGIFKTQTSEKPSGSSITFQVPGCLQSELSCDFGSGAESVAIHGFDGASEITRQGTKTLLTADLGKTIQPITIQWEKSPLKPREIPVLSEAYHWTVSPRTASLKCFWDLQTLNTGTDIFEFAIPQTLHLVSIDVSKNTFQNLAISKIETKSAPGHQRFIVYLNQRIVGNIQFFSTMLPIETIGEKWEIPLPKPVGISKDNSCYLAYHAQNCDISKSELPLGITGVNATDFAPFWNFPEKPNPSEITFAGLLGKEASSRTGLFLNISKSKQSFDMSQTCSVFLNPHQMTLDFDLEVSNSSGRLSFLEWDLDSPYPMTLNSLAGDCVSHWQQSGKKILIWLTNHPPNFNFKAKAGFSPPFQNQEFTLEIPSSVWKSSSTTKTILNVAPMWGFVRSVKTNQGYEFKKDQFETNRKDAVLRFGFKAKPLVGKVDSFLRNRTTDGLKQLQLDLIFSNLNQDDSQFLLNLERWPNQPLEWLIPENAKIIPLATGQGLQQFLVSFQNKTSRPQVIQCICQRTENLQANLIDWSFKGISSFSKNNFLDIPDPLKIGEKVKSSSLKDDQFFLHQIDYLEVPKSNCELFSTWWIGGQHKDLEIQIPTGLSVETLLINGQRLPTDPGAKLIRIGFAIKPGFHVLELACRSKTQTYKVTTKSVPIIQGQPSRSIIARFFSNRSTMEVKPFNAITYQLEGLSGVWNMLTELKTNGKTIEGFDFASEISRLILFKAASLNRLNQLSTNDISISRSIHEKMLDFPDQPPPKKLPFRPLFSEYNLPLTAEGLLTETDATSAPMVFQINANAMAILGWITFGFFLYAIVSRIKYHIIIYLFWPEVLMIAGLLYGLIPHLSIVTPIAIALWLFLRVWKIFTYLLSIFYQKRLKGT